MKNINKRRNIKPKISRSTKIKIKIKNQKEQKKKEDNSF